MSKFVFIICLSLAGLLSAADQIYLSDGKILQGTITQETASEYTIKLRKNMFLRVNKADVKEVKREPKKQPRNEVRLEQVKSTAAASAAVATQVAVSSPAAVPVVAAPPPPPALPAPKNPKKDKKSESVKIDAVTFNYVFQRATYTVQGGKFDDARRQIFDLKTGQGFMADKKRTASKTDWSIDWEGTPGMDSGKAFWTEAVVLATVTVALPAWKAPEKVNEKQIEQWDQFIDAEQRTEEGRAKIYLNASQSFAQALAGLRAVDENSLKKESKALFELMKQQVAVKEKGYSRRLKGSSLKMPELQHQ